MSRLDHVQEVIERDYGLIKGSFSRNRKLFGPRWEREFGEMLEKVMGDDQDLHRCLKGYTDFAVGSMRLHAQFIQDGGRYIDKGYEQAGDEVYHNRDHMMNEYLPGILLSYFLWVHHYRQLLFFVDQFVDVIARADDATFHDVGVGTGFNTVQILKRVPAAHAMGWDLSEHSLAHTERMARQYGLADRCTLRRENILTTPDIPQRPFVISVEVLEHLEDPLGFLRGLYNMLQPGGMAYVAAAVNAPHVDHIYHYRSEQEVVDQIRQAGFHVESYLGASAYAPTRRIPIVPSLAAVIASKRPAASGP